VEKLDGHSLNNKYSLISFHTIFLFTSIPLDLAVKNVKKSERWRFISRFCSISKNEFIKTLRLVLESTFDDKIYIQKHIHGIVPIIADLFMKDLENKALRTFGTELPFYYRYVDDIATAVPNHLVDEFLEIFKLLHPKLQFTLEVVIV